MSGNINNNERSMNGIISINAEDLKVNNLDAENINVQNLEILNSLEVNTTTLSPDEIQQLDGINTNETIQQQIDTINDNLVTKSGTQVIDGNKTFSGTTTFTGNISVSNSDFNPNTITISPAELSVLDGITTTLTLQEQLNDAGISNAMTLNSQQIANGQKTFTQPVGLPSVNYDSTNGTFTGFMSSPTTLTYSNLDGVFSVANSTIVGTGVTSAITSETTRSGTDGGEIVLTTSGTATPSQGSVDGYLKDQQILINSVLRSVFVFENVNNITQKTNNLYVSALRWNTTSSVTTPVYTDDFVEYVNYPNTPINSIIFESNSVNTMQPNKTARVGYIYDTNTFVQKPYVPSGSVSLIPVGDFLEGTGVIAPTKITARNNFSYTISSPNTITPSPPREITPQIPPRTNFVGYIDNTSQIYYSNYPIQTLLNYTSFVKGLCSPETMILSAGNFTKVVGINFNSVVSTPNYTKPAYILNASTIVFFNGNNLQLEQFVRGSGITKGKHYITALSNGVATLGDLTYPLTPTGSTTINGYLFTNNVLVGTGFILNEVITHPTDIPDFTTKVSVINPTFVNLSTSNNIPTPNNKTYNGFSPSSTEFYYNDTNTNVAIDYYLKDNNIVSPTTNHLITAVDTSIKKLTTANLPLTTPSISVNGYVNSTLNKIITETAQSISIGNGIDTTLINNSTRFVSSVNGIEIGVSGTLNSVPRINDTTGFCNQSNQSIVYDPNTRLVVGNFLVDYDTTNIPVNSIITSITSLGSDIYNVVLSSSLTFTPSTETTITNTYKPSSNTLAVNSTTLNNKIYEKVPSGDYRYTTSQTTDNNVYNTNDTGNSDLYASASDLVVIETQTNEIFLLSTYNDSGVNFNTLKNKFIQENTLVPTECFLKTDNAITSTMNESIKVTQNLSSNFTPFNYGNANNSPYRIGEYSNEVFGNAIILQYKISGVIIYLHRKPFDAGESVYIPQTGDVILDCTGTNVAFDFKAKKSNFTGLYVDMGSYSGTAPILGTFDTSVPIATPSNVSVFLYAITTPTIFVFRQNSTAGKVIFYYHPINNSIQVSRIKSIRSVVVGGTTYYEYTLNRAITADINFTEFDTYPSWLDLYYTYGGTFSSAKLRPPSTLQYKFYNPNSIITIDNQAEYESITPTNVNIYSSFDSYNSYEKKTFQQISPIQFELFNGTTFEEIAQVDFNSFEGLDFSIFTLDTFLAQTSVNVGFKSTLLTNDTFVTTTEFTNGIDNPLLKAPTIADGDNSTYPTFTGAVINYTGNNATKFYSSSLRIRHNQEQFNNVTFNQTNTTFDKYITSSYQPIWYFTGGAGNQFYGAGSRIGSYQYTGGQAATRSFNIKSKYGGATNANDFDNASGLFYANQGAGIYKVDLYVFCNNATSFNGRISLQTNAGRNQVQFNFSVNRNTSVENCTLLSWTWSATSTSHYFYLYTHSSTLQAYLGSAHTGLRVTKLL